MMVIRGKCKECGEVFFVDSENCGTDESLCDECFNYFLATETKEYNNPLQPTLNSVAAEL